MYCKWVLLWDGEVLSMFSLINKTPMGLEPSILCKSSQRLTTSATSTVSCVYRRYMNVGGGVSLVCGTMFTRVSQVAGSDADAAVRVGISHIPLRTSPSHTDVCLTVVWWPTSSWWYLMSVERYWLVSYVLSFTLWWLVNFSVLCTIWQQDIAF